MIYGIIIHAMTVFVDGQIKEAQLIIDGTARNGYNDRTRRNNALTKYGGIP